MNPYLGEIRQVAFDFAPSGWLPCNGALLAINQYSALFAVIGTTYGGDGQVNFAVPNLNGRMAMHTDSAASTVALGGSGGEQSVALTVPQLPSHTHVLGASLDLATTSNPMNLALAAKSRAGLTIFSPGSAPVDQLSSASMLSAGGSAAHPNLQPSLAINFIMAVSGIFPSRA